VALSIFLSEIRNKLQYLNTVGTYPWSVLQPSVKSHHHVSGLSSAPNLFGYTVYY